MVVFLFYLFINIFYSLGIFIVCSVIVFSFEINKYKNYDYKINNIFRNMVYYYKF